MSSTTCHRPGSTSKASNQFKISRNDSASGTWTEMCLNGDSGAGRRCGLRRATGINGPHCEWSTKLVVDGRATVVDDDGALSFSYVLAWALDELLVTEKHQQILFYITGLCEALNVAVQGTSCQEMCRLRKTCISELCGRAWTPDKGQQQRAAPNNKETTNPTSKCFDTISSRR